LNGLPAVFAGIVALTVVLILEVRNKMMRRWRSECTIDKLEVGIFEIFWF
jgi:hypothetical protein